ncbi:V-type ATPase subunit [Streptomyces sp. NPDC056367]|uniref:V-type ATPase subunit n=1 Tax=Streptomyces sp. NPDC056367 TaxID=3345797 RepID=UPI0035E11D27
MGAGWVAGVSRARALTSQLLGAAAARELAASASLAQALRSLAGSPYREATAADSSLGDAQRAVAAALLWNLRVLAGWLPPGGARMLRPLAAGFEIANVEARLRSFAGTAPPPAYRLGALGTASRRLERADSADALRRTLATSPWGDPGAGTPWAVCVGMRMAAAARTAAVRPARTWAEGRAALLTAREMFVHGRVLPAPVRVRAADVLGDGVLAASDFRDFHARLPSGARWAVEGVDDPADLWRAEARWWAVVGRDAQDMLRGSAYGPVTVVGAVAALSVDAWRVRAALELAAHGGGPMEVFDDLVG